jgi:hypothetical protein
MMTIQAILTSEIRVLRYSFRINWHQDEIRKLERITRKMLTNVGQHHPRDTLIVYVFPETRGKVNDKDGRSLRSRCYYTDGICRK